MFFMKTCQRVLMFTCKNKYVSHNSEYRMPITNSKRYFRYTKTILASATALSLSLHVAFKQNTFWETADIIEDNILTTINEHYMYDEAIIKSRDLLQRIKHPVTDVAVVAVSEAVSKYAIYDAYIAGQRHFGESDVEELILKSTDPEIRPSCADIKWHYIGPLERDKLVRLMTAQNLFMVHTIDSAKLVSLLDSAWVRKKRQYRLKVMVQINISEEPNKSGVLPKDALNLVRHIVGKCLNLEFHGLTAICAADHDESSGPNPDFKKLYDIKRVICRDLNFPLDRIKLCMGRSHNYEHAIEMGSNYVRVETAIFGPRKNKPERLQVKPQASSSVSKKVQ